MNDIQFQCTLSTPTNAPLYKTYRGLGLTYIELLADIHANVQAMQELGVHIIRYEVPKPMDLFYCWTFDEDIVYNIYCIDSQYNVEFRLTAKHS